jgi:hypothetical protein
MKNNYDNYMVNAIIIAVIVLLMNACTVFGQRDNNLMEVQVSIAVPEEDLGQYDTIIAYHNLESLAKSKDLVECLAVFSDIKPEIVVRDLSSFVQAYIETIEFTGYKYTSGEDLVYKPVYFNKYGYIVPYECAVAQLKGNNTNVKVMRDDEYQRVYHYDIED